MKTCEWCKKEYDGEGDRFCSRPCYLEHTRYYGRNGKARAVCTNCGKEYRVIANNGNGIFCSTTCYHEYKCAHPEQYSTAKHITVTCEYCGNEFEKKRSQYLKTPHHFCSRECSNKAHSDAIQKNRELADKKNQNAICRFCGKPYYVKPHRLKNARYCSRACMYASKYGKPTNTKQPSVAGDKNPNFKGRNTPSTARINATKYFGRKCMVCGWDTIVDVHHIIPRRWNGTNNLNNLIVLCPNHHRMADLGMISREELLNITRAAIAQLSGPLPRFDPQSPDKPESAQQPPLFDSPVTASQPD